MIFRWSGAKEGREVDAMKFAIEGDAMYARLEEEGRVVAHELCSNFIGTVDNLFIVRGDSESLGAVAMSPEFGAMMNKGRMFLEDLHWAWGCQAPGSMRSTRGGGSSSARDRQAVGVGTCRVVNCRLDPAPIGPERAGGFDRERRRTVLTVTGVGGASRSRRQPAAPGSSDVSIRP